MAFRNATLEQLGFIVNEEEIMTVSARLLVTKLLHGLPSVLNKNISIPHVHCAIWHLSRSKLIRLLKFTARDS